jgi:hypothetical protein
MYQIKICIFKDNKTLIRVYVNQILAAKETNVVLCQEKRNY